LRRSRRCGHASMLAGLISIWPTWRVHKRSVQLLPRISRRPSIASRNSASPATYAVPDRSGMSPR